MRGLRRAAARDSAVHSKILASEASAGAADAAGAVLEHALRGIFAADDMPAWLAERLPRQRQLGLQARTPDGVQEDKGRLRQIAQADCSPREPSSSPEQGSSPPVEPDAERNEDERPRASAARQHESAGAGHGSTDDAPGLQERLRTPVVADFCEFVLDKCLRSILQAAVEDRQLAP